MMSVPVFHESHSPTAVAPVTAAPPSAASVNAPPSYPFARPAAAHDGQSPSSQPGLGPPARLGQAPVYSPAASTIQTDSDAHGLVNAVQHPHQPHPPSHAHPHHSQLPPHQHVVTPPMQYSSVGGHGTSASPPGPPALTPAASSVSPPQKKNTRIPRACDLCSQRKVKVSLSPHRYCSFRLGSILTALITVRRWTSAMSTMPRAERRLYLRTRQEEERTPEPSCRSC